MHLWDCKDYSQSQSCIGWDLGLLLPPFRFAQRTTKKGAVVTPALEHGILHRDALVATFSLKHSRITALVPTRYLMQNP